MKVICDGDEHAIAATRSHVVWWNFNYIYFLTTGKPLIGLFDVQKMYVPAFYVYAMH